MLSWQRRYITSTIGATLARALTSCLVVLFAGIVCRAQAPSIAFVQANSVTPQASQTPVTVSFQSAQTAGNLNVVVVGWNDSTAQVSSVTDSSGNVYAIAAIPVVQTGTASQAIYYAKNIAAAAAGANTVSVAFTVAAKFPDVRIAEYSGLDTVNPLDVAAGTQGNSATSNSGSAATSNANDLLVAANVVQSVTTGAGAGYTSRIITGNGDILEDQVVTATASYAATATLDKVQPWIMQMVAFRAASSGTPAPVITSLSPTSGSIGTLVTIAGSNFGTLQGSSTVQFGGITAAPKGWSASSITAPVPSGATTGNVVVTVNNTASNGVNFTVGTVPPISFVQTNSATPQSSPTTVQVAYSLAQTAGNLNVVVVGWNDSTATVGSVSDTIGNSYVLAAAPVVQSGTASQAIYYAKNIASAAAGSNTVTVAFSTAARHPDIRIAEYSGLDPSNALDTSAGAQGNTASSDSGPTATTNPNDLLVGANTVQSTSTGPGTGYTSRGITVDGDILEDQVVSTTGNYNATATLDKVQLWIMQLVAFRAATGSGSSVPNIASLSPTSGVVGTSVTITGTNFGTPQGASTVTFGGTLAATASVWTSTSITVLVPPGASTGSVVATVNAVPSNSVNFTVTPPPPSISSLSPTSGPVGMSVTINGANFGTSQGSSTVTFGGTPAAAASNWNSTSITVLVPAGAVTGSVVVTVGTVPSNGVSFIVTTSPSVVKLVQHVGKDAGITASSSLAFSSNNTPGNWIAVAVRAGKSGQAFTITDTSGNTYQRAIQLNGTLDVTTLAIYYAENITGGANTVTVSDSISGNTLRFAILEYSGVAKTSSLDVVKSAQGHSTSPSTGNATTTANGDLLLGAVFTGNPRTYTVGSGYTIEDRVPAAPNTKLITEDQIQASAGTAAATATISSADDWGAVLASFKAATGSGGSSPSITGINPSSAQAGTSVVISGTNFGTSQGTSTVTFNSVAAAPASSWSATSISVLVPANATTGNVIVTVNNVASNAMNFTILPPPPSITSVTPNSGLIGTSVTIAGSNFGTTQGGSTVSFNTIQAAPATWSASSISTPVPNGATTGSVVVTVGGVASNGVNFTVTAPGPSISTLSMAQGPVGATVTITGLNFGASQGPSSTVTFGTVSAGAASNWTATSIDVQVPVGAKTGNVIVTVGGMASNGVPFTVTPPPSITSLNPTAGPVGTVVSISGANFGTTVGTRTSVVIFNGTVARPNTWADTLITVPVPNGATTGNVVVSISGVVSNGINFTVTLPPTITTVSPTFGPVGTSVTITGTNFGATQNTSSVAFNAQAATPTNWSDTSIAAPVPGGATTGNVTVTVGGVTSPGVNFTVTSSGAPIALVQHISKDAGVSSSSSLAFPANNAAGNWIGVAIRAGGSGQVFTVTDSHANTYKKAVQFNETTDGTTLGIFYGENIAGGANTVTVADSIASNTLRFSILEYSGIAPSNSLDATTAAQGSSKFPNSGNTTTILNGDLLFGAFLAANPESFVAGTGFKIEESVPAEPNSKLMVEDQIQAAAGTTSAGASLGATDAWAAALAAFRAASAGPPPPITVNISPISATVASGTGIQVFTATVQNDPSQQGALFSLSGAGCSGAACGTLSNVTTTSVTYTAPPNVPSPATVSLKATSVSDNTKSSVATITVVLGPLSVSVSPKRGSITTSQAQQFTGTVFNDPNNAGVTWQVDGNTGGTSTSGTISTAGLFTPGTQAGLHTIMATSVTNASVNTSVSFAVTDLQGVYMHHNDPARTGQNLNEYALTPATVNSSTFGQLFSCPVDGYVYAEPLYVANLLVGSATHNAVFIATEHDSVYAFDADSPSCVQLWKTSFLGSGVTTMPWQDTANPSNPGSNGTNDVFPEIGITSTPVIDPATNTIYIEAKTKETVGTGCSMSTPCYVHHLHALNIATGAEKFGGPVVISAPNFVPQRHFNRPALLLANNTIYIGFGSHGDVSPWFGWLFGYDPTTLARKFVFSTSDPTGGSNGAALWGGGAGPAADASGNIYVTTGNGAYDGTKNFSESVLKISPAGALLDWFTPFNRGTFDANDIDLGSAGAVILPDSVGSAAHPHLALATGKVAILYLLDQTNMGKFNSLSNRDVQEVIPVPPPNTTNLDGGLFGLPAYWNGNIYTTGVNYPLSQFRISNGALATPQSFTSSNMFPTRGATPAVSASGNTNGVVWILDLTAWPSNGNALLDAYDANNVSNLLFSSQSNGSGALGPAVKFTVPTVANGKVYVGSQGSFSVFGLLP